MRSIRKQHNAKIKAKIALEAVKEEKTISQLSSEYGVHGNQIGQWKKRLLEELPVIFSDKRKRAEKDRDELESELYRQIGQLKVELEWLKKNLRYSAKEKRELIESGHGEIPLYRQCELLGLSRSSYYYSGSVESELNLKLMKLIDNTPGLLFMEDVR